jgi:outer membrane receptor for ferrienterochelin and colicins
MQTYINEVFVTNHGNAWQLVLLLFLALMPSALLCTGKGIIRGRVTLGEEKDVMQGVHISLLQGSVNTMTDRDGYFKILNLDEGTYDLEISFIGYKRERVQKVQVVADKETDIIVSLSISPFLLNEVVVTGSLNSHILKETPVITEIISDEDLRHSGTTEVSELLRMQTGIEMSTGVGQTQNVRLQGLRKNQVLVLVDGERVSGKVDDALDINQIPVQSIERIEIVKGPMSSIYGSEAIGGVINIITVVPKPGQTTGEASMTVGSHGKQDYLFSGTHSFADVFGEQGPLNLLVSGGWNKYAGIDYSQADFVSESPAYDRKNACLRMVGQSADRFRFDLKTEYYADRLHWLAGGNEYVNFTDITESRKYSVVGSAQYTFGSTAFLKVGGNYSTNNHTSSEETGTGVERSSNTSIETIRNVRVQGSASPYEASTVTAGVELNDESINSQRILDGSKDMRNAILYAEDEWTMSEWTLNVGGRYADNSRFGSFFAPRLSALYRPTERLTLRASYGRGFRSPSINELFLDFDHSTVGYIVQGNPALQPETSHGINFGFDYARDDMIWFRINGYYNKVVNLINAYYVNPNPAIFSYQNISSATTRGIDVDCDTRLASFLRLVLGYHYNASIDEHGQDLPFNSPHAVTMKLTIDVPMVQGSAFARFRWYDRQAIADVQSDVSSANPQGRVSTAYYYSTPYSVTDVNLVSGFIRPFEATLGVNNIFNKVSYPFGQIKGREYFATLRFQL